MSPEAFYLGAKKKYEHQNSPGNLPRSIGKYKGPGQFGKAGENVVDIVGATYTSDGDVAIPETHIIEVRSTRTCVEVEIDHVTGIGSAPVSNEDLLVVDTRR